MPTARKSFGKGSSTEPGAEPATEPKAATQPAAEPTPETEPTPEPSNNEVPKTNHPINKTDLLAHMEARDVYREAGPLYGALNHVGDLGFEVGFHTGKGDDKQRAGIGVYLRVDHVAKRYPSKEAMDIFDSL